MLSSSEYRHELKYDIGYSTYLALRSRLKQLMRADIHAGADGKYLIRSIYFDNYRDKALREKINGNSEREKFRIRWYNDDFSFITLEKKQKINGLTCKFDTLWTEAQLMSFFKGERSWMMKAEGLTQELYVKMKTQQLKPRIIVSYTREPLVYPAGNVRITFDSDIRSSVYSNNYLKSTTGIAVADEPGRTILEVKYDEFLPDIIACLLQSDDIRQTAYSKYGASRRFD